MSFSLTASQFLDGSKSVTRRRGWKFLKPGDRLCAVRKSQGLKRGEKIERLAVIEVVNVRRETLDKMDTLDCIREGFPELSPDHFAEMFCRHMGGPTDQTVTRIEFKRVPQ